MREFRARAWAACPAASSREGLQGSRRHRDRCRGQHSRTFGDACRVVGILRVPLWPDDWPAPCPSPRQHGCQVASRRSRCERAPWPGPGLPCWTGRRIRLLVWSEELSPLGSIVLMFGAGRVIGGGFWGRGSRVWCSRVLAWRGRRRVRRRGCRGSRGPRPCSSLGGGGARGRRTGSGCPVER